MAGIISAAYNYVSGILSPPYCPLLVQMPMDPTQPEYTKSFTTDQVEEYQQVSNLAEVQLFCQELASSRIGRDREVMSRVSLL